jgi:uncharacterized membrane protein
MNTLTTVTVILALIGSALIGGICFAFSNFIMKALARLPSSEGMAAMQSINIVVLNPLFLGVFMGTAIISLLVAILALRGWGLPAAPYFLIGALFNIVGTFLVTGMGNVPLNNQLASINAADPAASDIWQHYLDRWTQLNTLRTVCATAASVVLIIGLMKF